MLVPVFQNIRASWGQDAELDDMVQLMRSDPRVCIWTNIYRQYLAIGDSMGAGQIKITAFQAFAPCARFYGGKGREKVLGLTDLCYLDIDNVEEVNLLDEAMDILRKDPNVVLASRSVSNEGLHIMVRYQLEGMGLPPDRDSMTPKELQDVYGKVYDYLAADYQIKLGLESDQFARHMERLYIVSYDPNLYYNPQAENLIIKI